MIGFGYLMIAEHFQFFSSSLMTGMIGRGYMIAVSFQSFCSSPMAAMEEIDQKALKYHRAVQNLSNTAPALLPEKILRPLDTTRRQFCRILAEK